MKPILIVDDEPQILTVLKRTLEAAGMATEGASSAGEALSLVRLRAFSLLLTDQVMPGMMGIDLIHRARSVRPEMTCLLMSGHPDAAEKMAEIVDAQIFRFVQKPWRREELLATVYAALGSAKLNLGPPLESGQETTDSEPARDVAAVIRRLAMDKQTRCRFRHSRSSQRTSEGELESCGVRGREGFMQGMFNRRNRKEAVQ